MYKETIIPHSVLLNSELAPEDQHLIDQALTAAASAYAPYSHFSVGAAALLANGVIVTGSNQENAAYPSGTCAERTALFYANAHYPDQPVVALAVVASTQGEVVQRISPCGACRQVLAEVSTRYGHPFRVLLYGKESTVILDDNRYLLPFTFDSDSLFNR